MATKRKPGAKRGRPPHVPTEQQRAAVSMMVAAGIGQPEIAQWIGVSVRSFRTHYKKEIKNGGSRANIAVVNGLFRNCVGAPAEYDAQGRVVREEVKPVYQCQMFWTKTRLGWREKGENPFDPANLGPGDSLEFKVSRADHQL